MENKIYSISDRDNETVILRKTVNYSIVTLRGILATKNMMELLQVQRNLELFNKYKQGN